MITLGTFDNSDPTNIFENDIGLDDSQENLALLSDEEAVMRIVKHRIQTKKYELQYDMNRGIPYFETIFDNSFYLPIWVDNMITTILGTEGVKSVEYFYPNLESGTHKLSYKCGVITTYGENTINGRVI